jgi:cation diffusion facilitator family transporter
MHEHEHAHSHSHGHSSAAHHVHTHGAIDPSILSTERGVWAIKWSFVGLFLTAIFQTAVVLISGSVALLADTIHNFGDAATAIPLWIAFTMGRRRPSPRFTYGLGRVEDLAGVAIVFVILLSAAVAAYESIHRFFHPQEVKYLWAVALASLIGFAGNEIVALFRIRVGEEIGSAALVADGHHARVDGLASLAVLVGAVGVWLGYPLADAAVGLLITIVILRIVWQSGKSVFSRLLDGVDPEVIEEIKHAAGHVEGVGSVSEVRVRWLGHRMHAELNIAVDQALSVEKGHDIAKGVRHELLHRLRYISNATIHVDPANASGEQHHNIGEHAHGDFPRHSHS